MNYSKEQIAAALDLAVLKPTATRQDIMDACALANKHGIKSVCVAPCNVPLALKHFNNVSAVIGFPHGNSIAGVKIHEAKYAIEDGAQELDVVINYGRLLDGEVSAVVSELTNIMAIARYEHVLVKAILETGFYTAKQINDTCELCADCGVDFVKTSTGIYEGATPGVVKIMLDAVAGRCGVKASGGINSYAKACEYLDLGCTRLGASNFNHLLP